MLTKLSQGTINIKKTQSRFNQYINSVKVQSIYKLSQGSINIQTQSRFKQYSKVMTQSRVNGILDSMMHCAEEACEVIARTPNR
jgi:hypothetical protein